jgi:hypothetical protein
MLKNNYILITLLFLLPSCSNGSERGVQPQVENAAVVDTAVVATDTIPPFHSDTAVIFREPQVRDSLFLVISKRDLSLTVYEDRGGDTLRIAWFPVCLGEGIGNKQKSGDHRTPESTLEEPFVITEVNDASLWRHDFRDGRGQILAYGHWFLRLRTPGFTSIGIHGSTNNEHSIPGRASEGCIRLYDKDIITLKERYAFPGMRVVVKKEGQGLFRFEQ